MSQQDDERIARKLLDLGTRSDRVQIRNGITYLDGYALGNGTVEIRSQVARDRRRRFIPEVSGYAAAILYEVVNGTNSEIWLQDDGAAPVLITTLQRRITLGWTSGVVPPAQQFIGYFLRTRLFDDVALDRRPVVGTFPGTMADANLLATYNTPTSISLEWGTTLLFQSIAGDYYLGFVVFVGAGSTELYAGDSILESGTVTVQSVSNMANFSLQRRRNGTYVYIRQTFYHSQSNPVPNLNTGNVWMDAQYWANGTLFTGTLTPDPGDITGSVLNAPLTQLLRVDNPGSPLHETPINRRINWLSETERTVAPGLASFLTIGESVTLDFEGPGGSPETGTFQGAPANARQVLSVAIYPRG